MVEELSVIREQASFAAYSLETFHGATGTQNEQHQSVYCGILGVLGIWAWTT